MSPRSGFGVWLQQSVQLTAVRAGTLFVHGGLAPELGFPGGKLSSLSALSAALVGATVEEAEAAEAEALPHSALLGDVSSLVEYRSLHAPGARGCERVLAVLAELNLSRMPLGIPPGDGVRVRCGGKLLALDSTLGRDFRKSGNSTATVAPPPRPSALASNGTTASPAGVQCQCGGQVGRLERPPAEVAEDWAVHVDALDEAAAEPSKVELR